MKIFYTKEQDILSFILIYIKISIFKNHPKNLEKIFEIPYLTYLLRILKLYIIKRKLIANRKKSSKTAKKNRINPKNN